MKILVDAHHSDLLWSWYLILNKRLNHEVYIPYGIEWYADGYHRLYGDLSQSDPYKAISQKFLLDNIFEPDIENQKGKWIRTIQGCLDFPIVNIVTLEQFKKMNFDLLITTCYENEEPWKKLINEWMPSAKLIRQTGNENDMVHSWIENCMYSEKPGYIKSNIKNRIFYYQEFDLDLFIYSPIQLNNNIFCFGHALRESFYGGEDHGKIWDEWRIAFPEYNFKSYGERCDDGMINPKKDYIKKMQESSFVWNIKAWDGYGHTIHNAFALGRPVIVREKDYKGKTAEPLLIDGETCIFVEKDMKENIEKIKYYSDIKRLQEMSLKARRQFDITVDFEKQSRLIDSFLERFL